MAPVVLKVAAKTSIASLKTAIVKYLEENRQIHVDAIGVGANYIALKAIVQAREWLLMKGEDMRIIPTEFVTQIKGKEGEERNAIRWVLTKEPGTI